MTQCGKACSGLYSDVLMLPNSSLLHKIIIKCLFFLIALYVKYTSVLTCVRHQCHPRTLLNRDFLLRFCATAEWLRTSFNYGCNLNDPAEQIIRSQKKLIAYLVCIIARIFFSISFPSVTPVFHQWHFIQPRSPITKKKKKITLWQQNKEFFYAISLEEQSGVGFWKLVSSRSCAD